MNEKPSDERLIEEIRGFRQDMRRSVRNALWVFAGSVVLVCVVFGPPMKKFSIDKDFVAFAGVVGGALLLAYLVGLVCQAALNVRIRKKRQQESFAILSGRTAGASRRE
ncbi:hypothetical protein [Haloferula sp. BvORR071]|uniref:hypothetical protein n=1 Tax=Haloferula sp. BvORR071 TaxID=1396141 RepID=UPI00054E454D|nr:hypothetical protein [Haloferula sp. BvORR071]